MRSVDQALTRTGLAPECLELEITENVMLIMNDDVRATLDALRERGVQLSLDDFGTGYSSLSYLKRFPVDRLKIDKSFVRDIDSDPDDAAIVRAIITLGHALNLRVVAEGVETAAHLDYLKLHGCDEVQGYYFSRPVPAAEMEALLRAG